MTDSKIKYALIGCGRIASNHFAAALRNDAEFEIAAVCDVVPEKMEALLQKFGLRGAHIARYTDYQEMLEKEHPGIAAIATDSGKHAAVALDCIHAGCHVLVEKPIALSLADADAVIAAAKARGVKLCACHQNRFNRSVQKTRAAYEAGRFGRLYHATAQIRWNRGEDYYRQAQWRGKWASDGGALMNQCIHDIDLLRWMMGEPMEVMAYTDRLAHPYIEAEDLGLAVVKFKNGSYGLIEGTTNVYPTNLEETFCLFGEKGTVKVGGKALNRIEEWCFGDGADVRDEVISRIADEPPSVYGFGHAPLYADMARAIRDDRQPTVTGEAGRAALEMVLAIYKSAAAGVPVSLPLSACASADFTGRFGAVLDR